MKEEYPFSRQNPLRFTEGAGIKLEQDPRGFYKPVEAAAPTTRQPPAPAKSKPTTFEAAIDQFIRAGKTRSEAIRAAVETYPDLHERYIAEAQKRRSR